MKELEILKQVIDERIAEISAEREQEPSLSGAYGWTAKYRPFGNAL